MHKILRKLNRIEKNLNTNKDLNVAESGVLNDLTALKVLFLNEVAPVMECGPDETKEEDGNCYTKEEYEIERILAFKGSDDDQELLVEWKGFPSNTDFTWETVKNLTKRVGDDTDMTNMFLTRKQEIIKYLSELSVPQKETYLLTSIKELGYKNISYNSDKLFVRLHKKEWNGRTKNLPYLYVCDTKIKVINPEFLDENYFVLKAGIAVLNPGIMIEDGNGVQTTDECIANILMLRTEGRVLEPLKKNDDCEAVKPSVCMSVYDI